MTTTKDPYRTILKREALRPFFLDEDGLHLLDQRALPVEERWDVLRTVEEVAVAIETLAVRGAPAIGGAAALGLALFARGNKQPDAQKLHHDVQEASARLRRTRPTAVNLFYALDRMGAAAEAAQETGSAAVLRSALIDCAEAIVLSDEAACEAMGEHGQALLADGDVVITVCHTGALATCGQGTALGVIKAARRRGKDVRVIALETRPLLQGARLTAWECQREGIPVTLVTDGMAGFALARKGVTKGIAGADRIAKNGDTANKIGTYGLATLCQAHEVPFFIAAPLSTIDTATPAGAQIPIEERAPDEVRVPRGAQFAPLDVPVWNPAFDVTPHRLIAAIATERQVYRLPADVEAMARAAAR